MGNSAIWDLNDVQNNNGVIFDFLLRYNFKKNKMVYKVCTVASWGNDKHSSGLPCSILKGICHQNSIKWSLGWIGDCKNVVACLFAEEGSCLVRFT